MAGFWIQEDPGVRGLASSLPTSGFPQALSPTLTRISTREGGGRRLPKRAQGASGVREGVENPSHLRPQEEVHGRLGRTREGGGGARPTPLPSHVPAGPKWPITG